MPTTNYYDNNKENDKENEDILYIKELLDELCDKAVEIALNLPTIVIRNQSDKTLEEKIVKNFNRRTSIVDKQIRNSLGIAEATNEFVNVRRTVSECIIHEHDIIKDFLDDEDVNVICDSAESLRRSSRDSSKDSSKDAITKDKPTKEKKKKKLSFNSLFGKKDKHKTKEIKEDEERHDNLPQLPVFRSNTLGKTKKYFSSVELHQPKNELHRTPSFIKKLVHISEDSSNFLKRSLSFRHPKKPEKELSRDKLTEKKTQEWRQSLQSLVETDLCVSYNDLSFVDYDALNDIKYESPNLRAGKPDTGHNYIGRTQSMIEKVSIF